MATAAECHALTSYFKKQYKAKYGKEPVLNRNVAKAQFGNMLMDYSSEELRNIIDFFLSTYSVNNHRINDLFYGYDKIVEAMLQHEEDVATQERLREETRKRVEEWRASGQKGIG
jgi:hypothetical protein